MRRISRSRWMMTSSVTVEPMTSRSGYGTPTYGAAVSYRAHLIGGGKAVRDAAGLQITPDWTVYLDGAPTVQATDRVTLSTGDVGSTEAYALHPLVLVGMRRFDEKGPHHTVLLLKQRGTL